MSATRRSCPTPPRASTMRGWAPSWPRWATGCPRCACRSAGTSRPTPGRSSEWERVLAADAGVEALRDAVLDVLAAPGYRAAAERMRALVSPPGGPGAAEEAVLDLLA